MEVSVRVVDVTAMYCVLIAVAIVVRFSPCVLDVHGGF